MNKRIMVTDATVNEGKLWLEIKEDAQRLVPRGQMLVDSENYSFIYLMESETDYTYIIIPEMIWPTLKEAYIKTLTVHLNSTGTKVELSHFQEELGYLIDNIKGNSNYGEEMVKKVENLF
jgi:hypothetical protein